MIRFGKSAGPLLAHKQSFFSDNDALLAETRRIAAIYAAQPRRRRCKCCDGALGATSFTKLGIDYTLCARCGHLNGAQEDSDAFCAAVYTNGGGTAYAKAYSAADQDVYRRRVNDIYLPKAAFLRDALAEGGEEPAALGYADLGAGSGYFLAALRGLGLTHSRGFEVSEVQAALGNAMLGAGSVSCHGLAATCDIVAGLEAEVVSLIGVLEHVQRPRELLAALRANSRVKYLFVSVPLFSPSVFFELAFPGVFPRQLSGGHTHLFTERSLAWLNQEFGLETAAEWWFGTDMVDLLRAVAVELHRRPEAEGAARLWTEMMAPALDDAQLALDRRKLASEVHLLLQVAG